jgi:hypothetical protein
MSGAPVTFESLMKVAPSSLMSQAGGLPSRVARAPRRRERGSNRLATHGLHFTVTIGDGLTARGYGSVMDRRAAL